MGDHNAVHSYYNNQSPERILADLTAGPTEGLQLVEISIDGDRPVLAVVSPYVAENGPGAKLAATTGKEHA